VWQRAVAIRPQAVATIPIEDFDGLNTFDDLPRDARCVGDYRF
jgi:hypothetical protein